MVFQDSLRSGLPFAVTPDGLGGEPESSAQRPGGRPWAIGAALLTLLIWWPLQCFWLSDDFVALEYATDWGRVWSDFHGPQYGLQGMVFFYRPLITLSFAIDYAIWGADPFGSHLANAMAQAVSVLLLARIAARFFAPATAGWIALVWGVLPLHAGSVLWGVGRVDCFTIPWIFLSAWFAVRYATTGRGRIGMVLAFLGGLGSKELAMATPGIATLLAFAAAAPGQRMRTAVRVVVPMAIVLVAYFGWRYAVLGRLLGGYADAAQAPGELLVGLGDRISRIASPLRDVETLPFGLDQSLSQTTVVGRTAAEWLRWVGVLPLALGTIWLGIRRGLAPVLVAAAVFLASAVPVFQFWASPETTVARYFALASAALVPLMACTPALALVVLMLVAYPFVDARSAWSSASEQSARIYRLVQSASDDLDESAANTGDRPLFVAGLPMIDPTRRVVMFHIGADRLTQRPFGSGRHRLFALRPLADGPDVYQLTAAADGSLGLPAPAFELMDTTGIAQTPPWRGPTLRAELEPSPSGAEPWLDPDGTGYVSPLLLWDIYEGRRTSPKIRCTLDQDAQPTAFRVTFFGGGGYVTCVIPADPNDPRGISIFSWLRAEYRSAAADKAVIQAIEQPVTLDLRKRFPLWIEAGDLAGSGDPRTFRPTASATTFVWLRFDADFAEFVAGRSGDPRK